jgi:hypothetical protein
MLSATAFEIAARRFGTCPRDCPHDLSRLAVLAKASLATPFGGRTGFAGAAVLNNGWRVDSGSALANGAR